MADEIWKEVTLMGKIIMVSSYGRIKGFKGRLVKLYKSSNGYLVFKYWNGKHVENKLVHRLVAEAFIPNPDNKTELDHIDTDRTNNRIDNLRWVTRSENCLNPITVERKSRLMKGRVMSDETRRKMSNSRIGNKNSLGYKWTEEQKSKLVGRKYKPIDYTEEVRRKISNARKSMAKPISQFTSEGVFIAHFSSSREAAEFLNICRRNIDYCISGKQKTCKGFIFKIKEESK